MIHFDQDFSIGKYGAKNSFTARMRKTVIHMFPGFVVFNFTKGQIRRQKKARKMFRVGKSSLILALSKVAIFFPRPIFDN